MLVSLIKDLFGQSARPVEDEFARATQMIRSEQYSSALDVLDSLRKRVPTSSQAMLLSAVAKRLMERPREAIADLTHALELGANPAECHLQLTLCWKALGDKGQAISHAEKVRELDPGSTEAFFLLTEMQLPGELYIDLLPRIISRLNPEAYVEIGVFRGHCLKLAASASAIVGIDPDPKIEWALEPHMKVFKTTSDAFFAQHDLRVELGGRSVDLAFIDGMHFFEFAMRDFANVERYAHKDTVVLIHDCYPMDEISADRNPRSMAWSGDVWRLIVLLKKYRPDLIINTIGTGPTGLAVIQNLDPQSTFLRDNHDSLCKEFMALEYSYLAGDKPGKLNLFPNDWSAIEQLIAPRAQ